MEVFNSSVILKTDIEKDISLPHTTRVLFSKDPYAIKSSPYPSNLYKLGANFEVFQLSPYTYIKKLKFTEKANDIIFVGPSFVSLSNNHLSVHNKEIKRISGDFVDSELSCIEGNIGVQNTDVLRVYNLDLQLINSIPCQSHFSIRDVLLTAMDNKLTIYINNKIKFSVLLPERISRICCDLLMSKIWCGSYSGLIYVCDLEGGDTKTITYHDALIVGLQTSFCGKYLYSADQSGKVCVVDALNSVVVGYVNLYSKIEKMTVIYFSECVNVSNIAIN